MRRASWLMAAAMVLAPLCSSVWAIEGDGLTPRSKATDWPRWQGRLSLGTAAPSLRADAMNPDSSSVALSGASLLGDFYFTRSLRGVGDGGGFRATSGILVGSRSTSLLSASSGISGRSFSVERRSLGSIGPSTSPEAGTDPAPLPYLGVGYTGLSSKGGWGFSADVGLMALSPASAVKLGRPGGGNQTLDDVLREMRFSPLVQVGVSYSF